MNWHEDWIEHRKDVNPSPVLLAWGDIKLQLLIESARVTIGPGTSPLTKPASKVCHVLFCFCFFLESLSRIQHIL